MSYVIPCTIRYCEIFLLTTVWEKSMNIDLIDLKSGLISSVKKSTKPINDQSCSRFLSISNLSDLSVCFTMIVQIHFSTYSDFINILPICFYF
jgi:hypothetical protein